MAGKFDILYQIVFFWSVGLLFLLERVRPFQRESVQIARRWSANISLLFIGSLIGALVIPIGIVGFAQAQPPGLLERIGAPFALQIFLTFLFLDLWRYWEHRLFHRIPLLWRLHLVHHSDTQLDITTAERHHPLEFLFGTAVLLALVLALGLPATGIGLYLLVATVVSFYSHANLRLPGAVDRLLRWVLVSPLVHAVHHSDLVSETNSNYGTVLTVWDRLFGSYVDPDQAQILHFGLEYFHQPRDTSLGRVLQQPFLYRSGMAYPKRDHRSDEPGPSGSESIGPSRPGLTRNWRMALLWAIPGCVLASMVLWGTLLELTHMWVNNEAYQYAWLVIPMVAYLLGWHYRDDILAINPQPDFSGVLVAVGAAALWSISALMNMDVGRHIAFVLAVQGVAMAMLGWRPYWRLFPVLALLFLMIPSGDLLQPFLRALTVKMIELFAVAAQFPHRVEGFVVFIGNHRYIVVDECSGLTYVTMAIFLSYCFGLMLYRSIFKIAALTLIGAFLGMFSNAVRVNSIVLIDSIRGSQMELVEHGNIQWIALFMTLGLMFFVLNRLKADVAAVAHAAGAARQRAWSIQRWAPALAGLSILVIIGSFMALPINQPRKPRPAETVGVPQNSRGWQLASPAANWTVDPQNHSESLALTYRRNNRDMQILIVETLSPNAKLFESRLAPDKQTWREGQIQKQSACVESRCLALLHTTWQRSKSEDQRHVFYSYGIGSFATDSKLLLRAAHSWHRLTGSGNSPRLIGFIFDDAAPTNDDLGAAFQIVQSALEAGSI